MFQTSPVSAPDAVAQATPSIWRLVSRRASPIVVLNDGEVDLALYCVHSVTGDVGGLRPLASFFGPRRVLGLQVPKSRMNEASACSIEALAERHVEEIVSFQPEGPIHLLGWSAGAIIALEMARQLRQRGREVPLLIALDGAPCNSGAGLPPWHPVYLGKLLANVPRWIRDDRNSDWSIRGVRRRIDEKLAFKFGVGADALRGTQTLDAETMNGLLQREGWSSAQKSFVHAVYKAMTGYVPPFYAGRVLIFETETQPLHHLRQIGAVWRKISRDPDIVVLKGNHSGLISPATSEVIARHVLRCMSTRGETTARSRPETANAPEPTR